MIPNCLVLVLLGVCCYTQPALALNASEKGHTPTKTGNFYVVDQQSPAAAAPEAVTQGSFVVEDSYRIKHGQKVADALSEWCSRNGWALSWGTVDIVAEADADIDGSFEAAVELLLDALNRGGAKISATYYDANRVLRIGEKSR